MSIIEKALDLPIGLQQLIDCRTQLGIATALRVQEARSIDRLLLKRFLSESLDSLESLGCHKVRGPGQGPIRSRRLCIVMRIPEPKRSKDIEKAESIDFC